MPLKARKDVHLARRLWHFVGVQIMFWLYIFLEETQARTLVLVMASLVVLLDISRLRWWALNRFMFKWLGPFMRFREARALSGATWMLLGVLLLIWLFPKNVALLSLLFLSVADPLAAYVGVRFGREKLVGQKTLQGSLAAFAACFVLTIIYFWHQPELGGRILILAAVCGVIGAASELVPIGKLDDNFVFPLVSASLLTPTLFVFGGL
jgi:diacylglycerol kinase (CTP)